MANPLFRSFLVALSVSAFVPAIADETPPPASPPAETPAAAKPYPTGVQCFFLPSTPYGYGVIDEKHMILDGSASRKYLVTFLSRCHGLNYAMGIALERHGSQICTGDAILAGNDRCVIRYLEQVKNAREGAAIVEARNAAEEAERKRKSDTH